jgi:hypothetical protein
VLLQGELVEAVRGVDDAQLLAHLQPALQLHQLGAAALQRLLVRVDLQQPSIRVGSERRSEL